MLKTNLRVLTKNSATIVRLKTWDSWNCYHHWKGLHFGRTLNKKVKHEKCKYVLKAYYCTFCPLNQLSIQRKPGNKLGFKRRKNAACNLSKWHLSFLPFVWIKVLWLWCFLRFSKSSYFELSGLFSGNVEYVTKELVKWKSKHKRKPTDTNINY